MAGGRRSFLSLIAIVQGSTVFVYTYPFYSQVRNRQERHYNRFNFLFFPAQLSVQVITLVRTMFTT